MEVSAKENRNVTEAFVEMTKAIHGIMQKLAAKAGPSTAGEGHLDMRGKVRSTKKSCSC